MTVRPDVPVRDTVARLDAVLENLDDTAARGPSGLPGWSRGHVLTHVENFSRAMTRQVGEAMAGRLVDMYDGGQPARNAAIEAGAGRSAGDLREGVRQATTALLSAWDRVGGDDWARPVRHRDGTLHDTVYTGWRELEVHAVDLDLGPTSDDWSTAFCHHLLDYLGRRTPDGLRLVLRSTDADEREPGTGTGAGAGEERVLTGRLTDLTAWLAGRTPHGRIDGELPPLSPWP